MELVWLQDFVALAECGNFSRAAAARHVTQPAFSRRIRALEEWVGVPLFNRTAHGCSLTAAGERFRQDAEKLVRQIVSLRQEARDAGGKESRTLRFAATQTLSFTFFPQWMRLFGQEADFGEVQLNTGSMTACEQMLLHGQAQFLLCHRHPAVDMPLSGDDFTFLVVGQDRLIALTGVDGKGEPRWRPGHSGDLPYLGYSADSGLGRIVAALAPPQHARATRHPVLTSHLAAALVPMVRSGEGLAWLPHSLVQAEMATGHLVRALAAETDIPLEICLVRPAGSLGGAAEAFWRVLQGQG